jgi:addiction module RelB/DinJ family antitoxin
MNTATIFIKTEPKIKEKAQKTAAELGFSLSSILNAFLRQLVKTKTITFSAKELGELDEIPSEYFRNAIKKAREERKQGKVSPIFDNAEDAIAWLHK